MKKLIKSLLLSILTLSAVAQQKVNLKLAPELNKPVKYEMINNMDIEGPQMVMMDMHMQMELNYSKHQDSLLNISAKYTHVKVDVNAGLMTAAYDSSKEPSTDIEKVFASQFKPLTENIMTYTMNTLGHIKEVDFPNVSEQVFDKSSLSAFGTTYPTHSVSIGDSWTLESKMDQLNVNAKSKFTLTEKTAEGYKIESVVDLEDATGNKVGTTTGYFIVHPKTFVTITSSTESNISMQGATIKIKTDLREVK